MSPVSDDGDGRGRPRLRDLFRPPAAEQVAVPRGLQLVTAYAWRLLVIAASAAVAVWIIVQLRILVVPLLIAILLTALLWPVHAWLNRHRWPRWLSITVVMIGVLAFVGGLVWLIVWQVSHQWDDVEQRTEQSIQQLRQLLLDSPWHVTGAQIDGWIGHGVELLQQQTHTILTGALHAGVTLGHVAAGIALAFFILIALLADGGAVWRWVVGLFPRAGHRSAEAAARNGWAAVVSYVRTQLMVALINAIGIGLGAFLLGVPLVLPVAALVFLGGFVPIVGAVTTGFVAVFLALVYNGPWIALAMLAVVLVVHQLESHVLQPILMGAAVKVHPLAVVLVVAGGTLLAGIPGALFAVPLAAFVNVVGVTLAGGAEREGVVLSDADLIWRTVPRRGAPSATDAHPARGGEDALAPPTGADDPGDAPGGPYRR